MPGGRAGMGEPCRGRSMMRWYWLHGCFCSRTRWKRAGMAPAGSEAGRMGGRFTDSLLGFHGKGLPRRAGQEAGRWRAAEGEAAFSSSSSSPASRSSPSQPGSSAWSLIQAFDRLGTWAEQPALRSRWGWPRCRIFSEVVLEDFSPPVRVSAPANTITSCLPCLHSTGEREGAEEEDGEASSSR